jgi:hypothetical protein
MHCETKTVVTFESNAFNMSEPKDYFINSCCFGDDVARWLIAELRKQGAGVDEEPGQEDFGWYLRFKVNDVDHSFVLGHRPTGDTEAGTWIVRIERNHGFIGSVLGGRDRGILPSAVEAIHKILSNSPLISDLRWHHKRDFDQGYEERGTSSL